MYSLQTNATPTERFSYVIAGLLRSANAFLSVTGPALFALIERRLWGLQTRFARLVAAVATGKPRHARRSRAGAPRPKRPSFMGPVLRLPTDRMWLIRLTPCTGMPFAGQLSHLLTHDAEMMALVASDARFGRILRPLFHMIRQPVPACVPALPPRPPRVRKPRAPRPPRPPRPIRQVTGRALLKYLPWKKPRPLMRPDGSGMGAPPGMKGLSISRKSER